MNKLILLTSVAAIVTLGIASESWAIKCPDSAPKGSDSSSDSNYCGVNCCWGIDANHVLTITPAIDSTTGKPLTGVTMRDFSVTFPGTDTANGYTSTSSSNAPWQRQGATSVVVENGISNIGQYAFRGDTKITGISGMENVTSIGYQAFEDATSLQSVDMPNVTSIGDYAFYDASKLQSVDLSKVTSIGDWAFSGASSLTNIIIPDDVNVYNWSANAFGSAFTNNEKSIITCLGNVDTCKTELSKKYGEAIVNKVQQASDVQCNNSVNYYYSNGCVKLPTTQETCTGSNIEWNTTNAKCVKKAITAPTTSNEGTQGGDSGGSQGSGQATSAADCAASGKYWQEGKCVSSCGSSFKLNDGWCDRQRYTPAEAAEVLKNDNTNEVTITFKK